MYNMMPGCQVGRSPSMLAAYNYAGLSIIVDNTNKENKKREQKKSINQRVNGKDTVLYSR